MPVKHGTNRGYTFYKCRCDECREAHRQAAAKDRERNAARINATKREWYAADPTSAATSNKKWAAANADKVREYNKARYQRDRDRVLELSRVKYLLNRQAFIDRAKRWKQENPERARELAAAKRLRDLAADPEGVRRRNAERVRRTYAKDPEKYRERMREWAKTPAGRRYFAAARARRRGVPYTEEALDWIASLTDPLCTYCGAEATSIDHIVPVSKGGTGELDNLTPACKACNSRKNSMSLENFLARLENSERK